MTADEQVVIFTPTLADTLAAQRLAARGPLWRYGFGAAAFAIAVAIPLATGGVFSAATIVGLTALTTAGYSAVLALIWRLWFPRRVARLHRQLAALHLPYRVSWDGNGLLAETPQSRVLVRWADYVKRRENDAVILLHQSDALFQFLPKRAFDAGQLTSLRPFLDRVPSGRRRAIWRP